MSKATSLLSATVVALQLLSPTNVLASEKTLADHVRVIKEARIPQMTEHRISQLSNRNKLPSQRPAFCPLNNSMTYEKTVESLKSIVTVFKDDCFDNNQNLIDQILTNSKDLEGELNKIAEQQGKEPSNVVPDSEDLTIDGIPLSVVMNGMNTLFSNNKCSNLDRETFLRRSADIIQTFSQFGLYSKEGISVAYGGLAVSSILRFIDNIFNQRFEFEKEADIETFVKLNCAYYDVRNQVKALEMFHIDKETHYRDKEISAELVKEVQGIDKELQEAKQKALELISKKRTDHISSIEKEMERLIQPLAKKVEQPLIDLPGKSAKYQQAEVLGELYFHIEELRQTLTEYLKDSQGPDRFLNMLFDQSLAKVQYEADSLMSMPVKNFNQEFLADLSSSFNRVLKSIEQKRKQSANEYDEDEIISVDDAQISLREIKELIASKELDKREEKIAKWNEKISALDKRLSAIVNRSEYSSDDSERGGLRQIIKSLDIVKNHIYGKYGKKFITKMKDLSHEQSKNFAKKFNKFADKYLQQRIDTLSVRPIDTINEDDRLNACVEAQNVREIWVYSQELSELGYDFLSTNNDIFGDPDRNSDRKKIKSHSDSAILARRIISAKNYMKKIRTFQSLGKAEIEIEGVTYPIAQASKVANTVEFYGKVMSIRDAQEYLQDEYGRSDTIFRKIGPVMLEIMDYKSRAILLQDVYKQYSCDIATTITR